MQNRDSIVQPCVPIVRNLKDTGTIPNNPKCPLLVYPGAFRLPSKNPEDAVESVFRANGWTGFWRNGIYPFHHYHSNTHEVLGVSQGSATVRFGGEPGVDLEVKAGDVVLIPAGVGHNRLRSSSDLAVVGAYPSDIDFDMCYGKEGERSHANQNIKQVPLPDRDPVYGENGPLFQHWKERT
jgi:uncharacterized protein YjlB